LDLDPFYPLLSKLKPSDQVVFIHLFQHKTNDAVYASQKNLMTWTGIKSINTIKTALNRLIQAGFVKCLKPGQQNAPALYALSLPEKEEVKPLFVQADLDFTNDNQLRLAALKRGFSPVIWEDIRRGACALKLTEDSFIIQKYFGPARLNG